MTDQEQRELFARNLQYYLNINNKRQVDLSEELGVSSATTSDWLNAKKLPRMGKIGRIAEWLGVKVSDLLEDKDSFRQEMLDEEHVLFDYKNLSEEDKNTVRNIIRALKNSNND